MLTVKELRHLAASLSAQKFRAQLGPFVLIQRPLKAATAAADPLGLPMNVAATLGARPDAAQGTLSLLFEFEQLIAATLPPLQAEPHLTVGRQPDCDLVLDDPSVSKVHARLAWDEAGRRCTVQDLGSTNGTCLNASTMVRRETTLRDGDILSFGDVHFWFLLSETLHAKLSAEDASPKLRSYSG